MIDFEMPDVIAVVAAVLAMIALGVLLFFSSGGSWMWTIGAVPLTAACFGIGFLGTWLGAR